MIPDYPTFAPLGFESKEYIESFTAGFAPYSDFNFTSLYCWNTDGSTAVSSLNGNLVIRIPDYLSGEPVYSLLGNQAVDESLRILLKDSSALKLVPAEAIECIRQPELFTVAADPDNFDYIYDLKALATLDHEAHHGKRKKTGRFARNYSGMFDLSRTDYSDAAAIKTINYIFDWWHDVKHKSADDSEQERKAIQRLIDKPELSNIITHILTVNSIPAGFSIHEKMESGYALSHFHKTLPVYRHADVFMNQRVAQDLLSAGCKYVNWEQDLGLEGLRQSKMSYHPSGFLKKFTVSLK